MRSLSWLSVLVVSSVLAVSSIASAQSHAPSLDPELALTRPDDELASIDAQSTAATVLYVTSVTLHVAGIATIVGTGIAGFCIDWGGGSCASARDLGTNGAIIGSVIAGVGLVGLFVAIGLDVGSGRRRREHQAGHATLSIAPSDGGATISFAGTF